MAKASRLSVIVPAFNEARRLGATLERVLAYLEGAGRPGELIVVDDGSRDGTAAVAEQSRGPGRVPVRVLRSEQNHGKGWAVRRGMLAAEGDVRLMCDADLSTPIEEVERLEAWLGRGYEVAIASRALPDSDVRVHQAWWREAMGKTFNVLVRLLALRGFLDTQCGFKAFRAGAARAIFARTTLDGFSFDVEALLVARRLGYRIREVPVSWLNSPESKVHPIRDAAHMLADLVRLRCRDLDGSYRRAVRSPYPGIDRRRR